MLSEKIKISKLYLGEQLTKIKIQKFYLGEQEFHDFKTLFRGTIDKNQDSKIISKLYLGVQEFHDFKILGAIDENEDFKILFRGTIDENENFKTLFRGTIDGLPFYVAQMDVPGVINRALPGHGAENVRPPLLDDLHWFDDDIDIYNNGTDTANNNTSKQF